jgi:hypothetical protein
VPLLVACASMLVAAAVAATEPAPVDPALHKGRVVDDFPECWNPIKCSKRGRSDPEPPPGPLGPRLTHAEILTEMKKVEPEVRACGRPVDIGKYVMVRFGISTNGSVITAVATGRLAGTPVGACVERAVKTIRFRENPGQDLSFPFVFKPRPKVIREPEPAAAAEAEPAPPASAPPEKVTILKPDPFQCGLQFKAGKCAERGAVDYEPPRPLGPPLTRDEVLTEMRRVEPAVSACGRPADVGGSVVVRLVISAKGRVVTAVATGRFEGTPTGMCVEKQVKTVQFRGNEGLSLNYAFPFKANAISSP